MGRGIEGLEQAYHVFLVGVLIILAILVILCLVRAIIGPRVADRIVSVNMMGTMVIVIIAVLALMLGEGYLADICIIYAMISFLAVVVLTKVYTGVYLDGKMQGVEKVSTQDIHNMDQDRSEGDRLSTDRTGADSLSTGVAAAGRLSADNLNTADASIESDEQENKT